MSTPALYALIAVSAGCLLAAKSGLNARLSVLTQDTLLATTAALFAASLCLGALLAASPDSLSLAPGDVPVPAYLWVVGGLLTAGASLSVYWLIPRLGVTAVITLGLAGQLVTSLAAGHLGWFGLPRAELTSPRALGALAVLAGALALSGQPTDTAPSDPEPAGNNDSTHPPTSNRTERSQPWISAKSSPLDMQPSASTNAPCHRIKSKRSST